MIEVTRWNVWSWFSSNHNWILQHEDLSKEDAMRVVARMELMFADQAAKRQAAGEDEAKFKAVPVGCTP